MKGELKKNWRIGDKTILTATNRNGKAVKFHLHRIRERSGSNFRLNWTEPVKGVRPKDKGDVLFAQDWEAKNFIVAWENEENLISKKTSSVVTSLSESDVRDAEYARSLFPRFSDIPSFSELASFWIDQSQARTSPLVQEAFDRWYESGSLEEGLRVRSLENRKRIRHFVAKYAKEKVGFIKEDHIRPFVFLQGKSTSTHQSQLAQFKSFFSFCVDRGWCLQSPAAKIKKPKSDPKTIKYYTVSEVKEIMAVAKSYRGGLLMPYLSLLFFCGVRPEEVHCGRYGRSANQDNLPLGWDNLHLDTESPMLVIEKTKGRSMRRIELEPNLVNILKLCKSQGHEVFPAKNGRRHFESIRGALGLDWIQDGARHTCLSAMYARDNEMSLDKISRIAGNSPIVLQRHYINPKMSKADAISYFQIGLDWS